MKIECFQIPDEVFLKPENIAKIYGQVFAVLDERFHLSIETLTLDELKMALKNILALTEKYDNKQLKKIQLNPNQKLLWKLFLEIGNEETQLDPSQLVQFLKVFICIKSCISSPLSWISLLLIIEREVVKGEKDIEILRALSKILHFLPDPAQRRLSGDFFNHIATLLKSLFEDGEMNNSPLHKSLVSFFASAIQLPCFEKRILESGFCKFLTNSISRTVSSQAEKDGETDSRIYEEIRTNSYNKNKISSGFLLVLVNFKHNQIQFEDKFYINKEAFINAYRTENNFNLEIENFKKSIKIGSFFSLHWERYDFESARENNFLRVDCILLQFTFKKRGNSHRIIAVMDLTPKEYKNPEKDKKAARIFVIYGENYVFDKPIFLEAEFKNKLKLNISTLTDGKSFIELKESYVRLSTALYDDEPPEIVPLYESRILLEVESLEIWTASKFLDLEKLQNYPFLGQKFDEEKKQSLIVLPSTLTIQQFLQTIYDNNSMKRDSLLVCCRRELVKQETRFEDLAQKVNNGQIVKIEINKLGFNEKQKGTTLIQNTEIIPFKKFDIVQNCSSLSTQELFPTLQKMVNDYSNHFPELQKKYKFLAKKLSFLVANLESLFGSKIWDLFFWFLFATSDFEESKKLLFQTILYGFSSHDLARWRPNDVYIFIRNIIPLIFPKKESLFHRIFCNIFNNEKQKLEATLEKALKRGMIKDKKFLDSFIGYLIWKGISLNKEEIDFSPDEN